MKMVSIYEFTVNEEVKNENGKMVNIVKFAGETQDEAASYVKMAGFTIVEFNGIQEKPKEPVYILPDLYTYREMMGQTHAI
jgi:hypothetical protein